jgi:hypothetical protein
MVEWRRWNERDVRDWEEEAFVEVVVVVVVVVGNS